jgi:hypothetical protein
MQRKRGTQRRHNSTREVQPEPEEARVRSHLLPSSSASAATVTSQTRGNRALEATAVSVVWASACGGSCSLLRLALAHPQPPLRDSLRLLFGALPLVGQFCLCCQSARTAIVQPTAAHVRSAASS